MARLDKKRMIYLDESGFVSEMVQESAWSPVGRPIVEERSGQRKQRINLLCGLTFNFKYFAPFLIEDNCNSDIFEIWFEQQVLHAIQPDAVIIMDNARFHRKAVLFEIIKKFNANFNTDLRIIFLPPYSPDFNPIEKFFGVLKGRVKRMYLTGLSVRKILQQCLNI
ncbi:transposase [Lactococcus garvieae]|uniref:transposase n=1 Tax=Lactococcus garvieae TaxID=1363 RepID=UPI003252E074